MRNYGRFTTSIWSDKDFTDLTPSQQAVYFMLATQPNVTAAGTLELTLRRWANLLGGMTPGAIRDELKALEMCPGVHVVVDDDTEEVLIRKFVKFDGGISNEKRRPVIREAALGIRSPQIRHALAHEIAKLGFADMASEVAPDTPSDTASLYPENAPSDSPSDAQSRFDRVVVKKRNQIPQPTTPLPLTATREGPEAASPIPPTDNGRPPAMFCTKHPDGTETPCRNCATARQAYAQHVRTTVEAEAETKRLALARRNACPDCDDRGMRLHPDSGLPLGRCGHPDVPPEDPDATPRATQTEAAT